MDAGLFLPLPIGVQSASPLYNWQRVRPWILSAWTPTSCNLSATSSIFLVWSSHPGLVLTVTGSLVLYYGFRQAYHQVDIFQNSGSSAFTDHFLTGQPKLISNQIGLTVSADPGAHGHSAPSSPPKIWMKGLFLLPWNPVFTAFHGVADRSFAADEFTVHQVGPIVFTYGAKRRVAHILHRCQQQRKLG